MAGTQVTPASATHTRASAPAGVEALCVSDGRIVVGLVVITMPRLWLARWSLWCRRPRWRGRRGRRGRTTGIRCGWCRRRCRRCRFVRHCVPREYVRRCLHHTSRPRTSRPVRPGAPPLLRTISILSSLPTLKCRRGISTVPLNSITSHSQARVQMIECQP